MTTTRTTDDALEQLVMRFPEVTPLSARRWLAAGESLGRLISRRPHTAAPSSFRTPAVAGVN